jgi:hypothetical protein
MGEFGKTTDITGKLKVNFLQGDRPDNIEGVKVRVKGVSKVDGWNQIPGNYGSGVGEGLFGLMKGGGSGGW